MDKNLTNSFSLKKYLDRLLNIFRFAPNHKQVPIQSERVMEVKPRRTMADYDECHCSFCASVSSPKILVYTISTIPLPTFSSSPSQSVTMNSMQPETFPLQDSTETQTQKEEEMLQLQSERTDLCFELESGPSIRREEGKEMYHTLQHYTFGAQNDSFEQTFTQDDFLQDNEFYFANYSKSA